ncbi:MAG TPA: hypothetical protein VNE86_05190 [Nitrososphaerales archaeon]|nr:hypothetical protein [Nitrososphaerales archaeon]
MSFAGGSGRSFAGKSSQKKDRKKKQEFHKHKVKFTEEEHIDFKQSKDRVALALDKLGHQMFSLEPGGYSYHNWMMSFNLLLDDFEEKAGPSNLPKDYYDARLKITADLLQPAETADIDWEIKNLETEIDSVKLHMSELTKKASEKRERLRERVSKIYRLKREQLDSEEELGQATKTLDRTKKRQSLFSRLFSASKNSSVDSAKKRVDSLKSKKEEIDENLEELEAGSEDLGKGFENEIAILKEKLEDMQQSEAEFITKKDEKSQLSEIRAQATAALSQVISSLKLRERAIEENTSESD